MMKPEESTVLVADDEESYRRLLTGILSAEGYAVLTAADGVEAINRAQEGTLPVVLLDLTMPRVDGIETLKFLRRTSPGTEVIMLTGSSDIRIAVECMKLGAYDFVTKPTSAEEIVTTVRRALEHRRLRIENVALANRLTGLRKEGGLIGESPAFLAMLALAARVAPTDSTVLIRGASGTGKELVAQFLHEQSLRKDRPFITLNCASIPDTLLESELFGHEKGAFTDAHATKPGIAEIADSGSLFLDEIGDISPVIQPKILRFVQTGEFRRVGGNTTVRSDCRILSATNKDLGVEVREGRFREDLYYRLNVITLTVPDLRTRREDIPLLVRFFLEPGSRVRERKSISPEAVALLMDYDWPGNIRELENVIERAAILCRNNVIGPGDLFLPQAEPRVVSRPDGRTALGAAVSLREIERAHIEGVLAHFRGSKAEAARVLGISLKTLYTKIQQYGLASPAARGRSGSPAKHA